MSTLRRTNNLLTHLIKGLHQKTRTNMAHSKTNLDGSSSTSEMPFMPFGDHSKPVLQVSPKSSLADDLLDVRASGLRPGQRVALQAEVQSECQRFNFRSEAKFQADMKGEVNVKQHASLGGTYEGVEPMGLIWSCQPVPEEAHLHPRVEKADSSRPLEYTISLLDRGGPDGEPSLLASEVVLRSYLADHVERVEVSHGKARGVWFIPRQRGASDPLPVVIEFRGLRAGRVLEDRASLLASHGYAVLVMDYVASFDASSEDPDVFHFDAQAILDVLDYIRDHDRLDANRIGMFGFCTGGTVVLHAISRMNLPIRCAVLSSIMDELSCIFGIKNPDGYCFHPFGKLEDFSETYEKDGFTWFRRKHPSEFDPKILEKSSQEDFLSPVENISVPTLLLIHGDDQYSPSVKKRMNRIISAMREAGNDHLLEVLELEGAGHLLDAPYMPICSQSSLKFPRAPHPYFTKWGGRIPQYAHAVERSWKHHLSFFRHHLGPTENYR